MILKYDVFIKKLKDYFSSKEEIVYKNIASEIEQYIRERFE